MIFIVTEYGSCTTFVTREIEVEAETKEEAKQMVQEQGKEAFKYTEEFSIDDDYSEIESVILEG